MPQEWSKHKYIRKEGDRYIYPEDLEKEAKSSSANRSTYKLSSEGKEMWNYVKADITSEKNDAIDAAKAEREQKIAELRQKAEDTRAHIQKQLNHLAELMADQRADRLQQIETRRKAQIASLEARDMPEGLSRTQKEQVEKARARELQSINAQANKDKEHARKTSSTLSDIAKQNKESITIELKTAVEAAKTAYEQKKAGIDKDYEAVYQEEYERILSTYPQVKKSSGKGKGRKSTDSAGATSSSNGDNVWSHSKVVTEYRKRGKSK